MSFDVTGRGRTPSPCVFEANGEGSPSLNGRKGAPAFFFFFFGLADVTQWQKRREDLTLPTIFDDTGRRVALSAPFQRGTRRACPPHWFRGQRAGVHPLLAPFRDQQGGTHRLPPFDTNKEGRSHSM